MNNKPVIKKFFWAIVTMLPVVFIGVSAQARYGDTTQTVVMNNSTGRYIQFEFTDDGNRHVWPGEDKAYSLPPGDSNDVSLNCYSGQKICYGAWVRGDDDRYWGVGNNNSHDCDDCCFRCVGDSERYNLEER